MDRFEENVAMLKKLREMLARQREKFGSYLRLLECEGRSIEKGDSGKLLAQVEMEQSIIADIFTLRKVIEPLETLYYAAYPKGTEITIPRLQSTLETLGAQILSHNRANRQKLKERIEEMRREITSLRAWPKGASPFAEVTPGLIDITT